MAAIHYSNFLLEDNKEYFLYIGELKNYGLNVFLQEALSRIYNKPFAFIAIVPDIFEQYNYENLIVINPLVETYACRYGPNVSCRISAQEFMRSVSQSRQVRALIQRLRRRQDNVFLYMYESLLEMTLDDIPGVIVLGPEKRIANRLNSKIYQYEHLSDRVPTVEYIVCKGGTALRETTGKLWDRWRDGIFISEEYSAAGIGSMVASGAGDMVGRFDDADATYFVSRYVPHDADPTLLAVVANEEEVYVAGVADQRIEAGTRFTGSVFPSALSGEQIAKLEAYTMTIGKWMGGEGYRGIFGCDYLVAPDGDIRFLEVNARKQGTTLEFCCTLEQSLGQGAPSLPELEYYAVMENLFPLNTQRMIGNPKNLHWGTYNYKIHHAVHTDGYIPQSSGEREAFRKVAAGNLKKDFLILEHTGADFVVAEGAFIGRIVALGQNSDSVLQGLKQGIRTIDLTIDRHMEGDAP